MINQSTMDKLIEMRLTAMADAFRIQMDDSSMKDISFEERFGMLVDVEYTSRKNIDTQDFAIVVPGDKYICAARQDESVETAIRAMKAKLREKKNA